MKPPQITDRAALLRNRARATPDALFLQELAADEIQERLSEVNRTFNSIAIVAGFPAMWSDRFPDATIISDDETLDLAPKAHDLVVHAMSLHWANDPVGQLIQSRRALRPDGLLVATLFGGQTLHELRACLAEAESRITGGLSPRVLPMGDIRDLGGLLQRSGLALPVSDTWRVTVRYDHPFKLMQELRMMGEGNALSGRLKHPSRRSVLAEAARLYQEGFSDPDGRIRATFEICVLTGWAPADSQPQPLRPGSASARLAEALKTTETKLPD